MKPFRVDESILLAELLLGAVVFGVHEALPKEQARDASAAPVNH